MTKLAGKSALITGASQGIGRATAITLAEQGASLVLAARNADALESLAIELTDAGHAAIACPCDVAVPGQVESAVRQCLEQFGRIDILVNNAAVIEPIAHLADVDVDAWNHAIDINIKGVFHGLRFALPAMQDQGSGYVINISSGAATQPLEGWSHYCASKAAVLLLTKTADLEMRPHGIQVVGLSPGTVATNMQVVIRESGVNPVSQLDPNIHIPPDWVAKAVAFLATDAARGFRGKDFSLRDPDNRKLVGL